VVGVRLVRVAWFWVSGDSVDFEVHKALRGAVLLRKVRGATAVVTKPRCDCWLVHSIGFTLRARARFGRRRCISRP
jgi:hypothetical protein